MTTINTLLGDIHGAAAVLNLASEARPDDVDLQHALRLALERLAAVADELEAVGKVGELVAAAG